MMGVEGPYYIHCLEGKDRTGTASLLASPCFYSSAGIYQVHFTTEKLNFRQYTEYDRFAVR